MRHQAGIDFFELYVAVRREIPTIEEHIIVEAVAKACEMPVRRSQFATGICVRPDGAVEIPEWWP